MFKFVRRLSVAYRFLSKCTGYSVLNNIERNLSGKNVMVSANISGFTHINRVCIRSKHDDSEEQSDYEDFDEVDLTEYDASSQYASIRHVLNKNIEDPLLTKINECASVQELFDVVEVNQDKMEYFHVSQTVLVLWDIQKMFYHLNNMYIIPPRHFDKADAIVQNYIHQLTSLCNFKNLLKLVENHYNNFDEETLSCMILYLNYIGLALNHPVIQLMIDKYRKNLTSFTSLTSLSRVSVAVFNDQSLMTYYLGSEFLQHILNKLESCENSEDFKLLTICLNSLNRVINADLLIRYKDKVEKLIKENVITSNEYRTILKIIMFLNYPQWREKNSELILNCVSMLKNSIEQFTVQDMCMVWEILYTHQEPAFMLNQIQHKNSKLYYQLEDEARLSLETRLKLLSSLICFSNIINRKDVKNTLNDYVLKCNSEMSLDEMYRMFVFTRTNEWELYDKYWMKFLQYFNRRRNLKNSDVLIKACSKYLSFSSLLNYRNKTVEGQLLKRLEKEVESGILGLIPSKFSIATAFIIAYGTNNILLKNIICKLEEILEQLSPLDCLSISRGIQIAFDITKNKHLKSKDVKDISTLLDKHTIAKANIIEIPKHFIFLEKGCIYRKTKDFKLQEELLNSISKKEEISSRSIRSVIFCFQSTGVLIPEIMEKISAYIIHGKSRIMGFNVCSAIYFMYYLGYIPKNADMFCSAVTDIIIRDQERLSGLSYLQALLSLCFFNKLPNFFIKQVFNVKFLEKLDAELKRCYSKDKYPLRVRYNIMQLNRAVCLDYPESNVPWFHQKYIQQITDTEKQNMEREFTANVRQYLVELTQHNPEWLLQNVITPYGYHIDFVIHLNNNRITGATNHSKRLAILLLRPNAFTRVNIQLKGEHQLKLRHLEMLGYNVIGINFNEWKRLLTKDEKLGYLMNLIFPSNLENATIGVR